MCHEELFQKSENKELLSFFVKKDKFSSGRDILVLVP